MIASDLQLRQIRILNQASLWSLYIKSAHNWRLNDYIFIYLQRRTMTDRGSAARVAATLHYLLWLIETDTTGKNGMTCYYRLKQSVTNRVPFYFLNNAQVQRSTVRAPRGALNVSWLCGLCFQSGAGSMRRVFRSCGCVHGGRCSGSKLTVSTTDGTVAYFTSTDR